MARPPHEIASRVSTCMEVGRRLPRSRTRQMCRADETARRRRSGRGGGPEREAQALFEVDHRLIPQRPADAVEAGL